MSTAWYSKKWVTTLLHAAIWILLFSLPYILRPSLGDNRPVTNKPEPGVVHFRYAINNLIYIAFFYLNAFLLFPQFVYRRKYKQYLLLISALFIVVLSVTWFVLFVIFEKNSFDLRRHILFNFFFYLFILAASIAYSMIMDRAKNERLAREKENENLKTELSLLRSQASPHFMFNVLNNMVALARKKSDLLEPSLMKFSSLMRYMLYEADEEKVALEKEVEYLQSYIDLQQQRFGNNVKVNVSFRQPDKLYEIEPMLLIPFVENAFKHGTGIIEDAQINIELKAVNNVLSFSVENKYNPSSIELKDKTAGIGLPNVKRRLDLLYGKNQRLQIGKNNGWFSVLLNINFN